MKEARKKRDRGRMRARNIPKLQIVRARNTWFPFAVFFSSRSRRETVRVARIIFNILDTCTFRGLKRDRFKALRCAAYHVSHDERAS